MVLSRAVVVAKCDGEVARITLNRAKTLKELLFTSSTLGRRAGEVNKTRSRSSRSMTLRELRVETVRGHRVC